MDCSKHSKKVLRSSSNSKSVIGMNYLSKQYVLLKLLPAAMSMRRNAFHAVVALQLLYRGSSIYSINLSIYLSI